MRESTNYARRKSLWQAYENHAIYNVKSPRKKRKPIPAASQVSTFDYLSSLRRPYRVRAMETRTN